MVVLLVNQEGENDPNWAPYYSPASPPTNTIFDYSGASPYGRAGYVVIDLVSNEVYADQYADIEWFRLQVWGQPVYYDGCVLWCAACDPDVNNAPTKYFHASAHFDRYVLPDVSHTFAWGGEFNASGWGGFSGTDGVTFSVARGNTAVTIVGTAPTYSIKNKLVYAKDVFGGGTPAPKYTFLYKVKSHTAGASTATLDRPYGLGESASNTPDLVSCSMSHTSFFNVFGSIPGGVTLAVFNERIFSARGTVSATLDAGDPQAYPSPVEEFGGYYGNAVFWSKPGNFNRWPDENFALVDQDAEDPITGLYTLGDALIIFKTNKMFALTGYDEDSFQISKISDVVGCPYPMGMIAYEGTLFFANQEGVWAYDGQSLRSITSPDGSRGISQLWASRPWSRAQGMSSEYFWPTMAVTPDAHLLFTCHYPLATDQYTSPLVYDIKSDAWAEWSLDTAEANPIRVVTAPNGRVYGVHRWFISDITDVFNPAVLSPRHDSYPALSTGTTVNEAVVPVVDMWLQAAPGHTFRVREMQVDHKVHYAHTTDDQTYQPWTLKFATDPDLDLGSAEHSVNARWVTSSGYVYTNPRHYSDRLPETFQREAQTFRIRLTGNTYQDSSGRMKDWSLYALKLTVDATRQLGVDNSTV
jgi:hypothetical protein